MGLKILRESEPGQPLPPEKTAAVPKDEQAERDRLQRIRLRMKSPFGRGCMRVRRGRLRKMKVMNRKRKFVFGSHLLRSTGYAESGHRTYYYHATKGWRRRCTADPRWLVGNTLINWMLLRLDLIDATKAGDRKRIQKVRDAFKRTLQTP